MNGIPDPHRMIPPPGSNVLPIRRPCHSEHLAVMVKVGEDAPSSGGIPHPGCCIIACRGNVLPIGRPRHGTNYICMTTTYRENENTSRCDMTSYGRNRHKMGYAGGQCS